MNVSHLSLDARYELVREAGVIAHRAVLVAIGSNWDSQRQVLAVELAVELADRESQSIWKEFLPRLKERGFAGVAFVVSDDHAGLKKASSASSLGDREWAASDAGCHFL